jgi:hypothetical protein
MGYQEHEQTYKRMHMITTRFLAAINYGGNVALPIFHVTRSRPPALPRLVVRTRHRRPHHAHPSRTLSWLHRLSHPLVHP